MVGLPRSIIKKYGVSKKAWAVFRSHGRKGGKTAARRGGSMTKKKGHRSRGGMGGMLKPLLIGAVAGYASRFAPVDIPYKAPVFGAGAAYALGNKSLQSAALGAVGAYGAQMLTGGSSGGSSGIVLY